MLTNWLSRLKRKTHSDVDDELQFHIDQQTAANIASGMSPKEAQRQAAIAFGGIQRTREQCREQRPLFPIETLLQDIRYAIRSFKRNPLFTLAVAFTLALSIGANTAIFSLVNALLLKNLPYVHPDRIGTIYAHIKRSQSSEERTNIDGEQWEMMRDNVPSLISAVTGAWTSGVNLQAGTHVQYLHAGRVSAHYFDVLALHPIIGRNFSDDEDRPHGPKAAILSYDLWRTTFDKNPNVQGMAIQLKGEPYTIVGVLPQSSTTPLNADLYTSLQPSREGEGSGGNFGVIMRLRDGATWQQADAEINRAWAHTHREQSFAKSYPGAQRTYFSVPLQKGETDTLRPQVLVLMLAAGFILLIACANLAGLTLVRMLRRTGEIATRMALGASRWQIQRQLWIENLLLALIGGAAGVGVGFLALRGLLLLLPEHFLPVATVSLDNRVLAFALVLSLSTSVVFGMLPALTMRKVDLRSSIASRSVIGAGSIRLRQGLIVGEVALTVVLLAAAGLLIRTLIHLETMPPGFNPNGVITAKASLDDARYQNPEAFQKLIDQSLANMRQISGVQSAAVGLTVPYERALLDGITLSDGKDAGHGVMTNEIYVTPGYFDTLQIPMLSGRTFTDADGPDTQPSVIINQTFARKFFHNANPVGRYLNKNLLIVGVVADTMLSSASGLNQDAAPLTSQEAIYIPASQVDSKFLSLVHVFFQPSWIVRTSRPIDGLTAQMQRAFASADPNLPFSGFYSMKDLMAATLTTQRIEVALLTAMASLALLLSAVGIFALVANVVAQRTREIGIRIALGSTVSQAMIHIGKIGAGPSALGLALGLLLCAGTLRAMHSALYGIGTYDLPTILAVIFVLAAVTILATTLPTLRIAAIDPAKTLREE